MKILVGLLVLSGCTAPHYFIPHEEKFSIYRGFNFHVVSQQTVWAKCGFPRTGCVSVQGKEAHVWVVDNRYAFLHECDHVDGLLAGKSIAQEQAKDALLSLSGFNDLAVTANMLIPAPRVCPLPESALLPRD